MGENRDEKEFTYAHSGYRKEIVEGVAGVGVGLRAFFSGVE